MSLNPDDIVGSHYQIICELGRGGFGITYLARDINRFPPNDLVALKQVCLAQQNDDVDKRSSGYVQNLEREAQTLSNLQHDRIPRFIARFEENGYYYIIQEYIEGNNLSEEIIPGRQITQIQAIEMLREILEILQFVHQQGIIHRDIKPANLIRRKSDNRITLIDFGVVKEIATQHANSSGVMLTRIAGTPAYMSGEQSQGIPRCNSDIYALGIILMQAVTGFSVEEICDPKSVPNRDDIGNYLWEDYAPQINPKLKKVISRMIRYYFTERYQSTEDVLASLAKLNLKCRNLSREEKLARSHSFIRDNNNKTSQNKLSIIAITTTLSLVILGLTTYWQRVNLLSLFNPACTLQTRDYISCGEEILYVASKSNERIKASQSVIAGNYKEALEYYRSSWEEDGRDAETLIYLNNALLEAIDVDYYTLAVAVPLSYKKDIVAKNYELGQYFLRGVAQLQTEINLSLLDRNAKSEYSLPGQDFFKPRKISEQKPKGLKIVIVDDRNSEVESKNMALTIANKPKLLGLIGHYTSNVTLGAVDIYNKKQLPEISFGSTSLEFSSHPRSNFFRVVYSNIEEANATLEALNTIPIKDKKIAIFYNPQSDFSNKLRFKIEERLHNQKINIVKTFNIADEQNFSTTLAIKEAKNKGANIFILLPDGQETNALARAMELIQQDNGNTAIIGSNPLVNTKIEQLQTDFSLKLIAASFWHPLNNSEGEFMKNSQKLWKTEVSSHTAMAYDAMLAFVEAIKLQNNPTRKGILNQLKASNFNFEGATGQVKFNTPNNGDRVNFSPTLVHLVPCKNGDRLYEFVPIKYSDAAAAGLRCN